jgi:30S ribosomal protein S31
MGKGDKRTRRGKIYRGTFGKARQRRKKKLHRPQQPKPTEQKEP